MNRITIYADNSISVDGKMPRYAVKQAPEGTTVYPLREDAPAIRLPAKRYSLAASAPNTGIPGIDQFNADFLRALDNAD